MEDQINSSVFSQISYEYLKEQGIKHFHLEMEPNFGHGISEKAVKRMCRFYNNLMIEYQTVSNDIITSQLSQSKYRYMQLSNQVKCLFVKNPQC